MLLPGIDVRVVDDMGNVVLAPPLAHTSPSMLWMNVERYHEAYWKRYESIDYSAQAIPGWSTRMAIFMFCLGRTM